jgi:hypothetical protein
MASKLMSKSKKLDPYLELFATNGQNSVSRQIETHRDDKLVENTTVKRRFADFKFGALPEPTVQLPATIDSVRAMILAHDASPIDLRLLRVLDLLKRLKFEQARNEASASRRLSVEIKVENCRLEIMSRPRLAGKRLGVALLEQWYLEWIIKLEKTEINYQTLAEMGDVMTYCSLELKKFIDKQCQVRGRLFSSLFNKVIDLYSRVFGEFEKFLDRITDFNEEVMQEAKNRVKIQERRLNEEIAFLKGKMSEKNEYASELTSIIRHLNVKLGNSIYAQKHIRTEIRQYEEKNQILEKENYLISEIIKKVIQDLRGSSELK